MRTGGQIQEGEHMSPGMGGRATVSKCPHCMVSLREDLEQHQVAALRHKCAGSSALYASVFTNLLICRSANTVFVEKINQDGCDINRSAATELEYDLCFFPIYSVKIY